MPVEPGKTWKDSSSIGKSEVVKELKAPERNQAV
jgi:hypothetical protein